MIKSSDVPNTISIKTLLYFYGCFTMACLLLISPSFSGTSAWQEITTGQIDSIIIINKNVFDLDSAKYNYWPFKLANQMHIRTRKYVIKRELLQKVGDSFSRQLANETERNLRMLPYLWHSRVRLFKNESGYNVLEVTTADSWTLSGGISFNRIARENIVRFRLEESNLFGLGQYLSFNYYVKNYDDTLLQDDSFWQVGFRERRLFGSRNYFEFFYDQDPEIGLRGFGLGLPYFSLDSKLKYSLNYYVIKRREDYYADGNLAAQDRIKGNWLGLSIGWRFGSYNQKVAAGIVLIYKDIKTIGKELFNSSFQISFPEDSVYYGIIPEFSIYTVDYYQTQRISSFNRIEDFTIMKGAKMRFGSVINAVGRKETLHNLANLEIFYGAQFRSNLVFLGAEKKIWYKGGHDFRKKTNISIRYYNNGTPWITAAFRFLYNEDLRDDGTEAVYLGENNGIRGYPKNYLTGEKRTIINIENRIFPGFDLFSAKLGLVIFIDVGQSWTGNRSFEFDNMLWSSGMGIRMGFDRVSSSSIMRFDLAYAQKISEWQLSFGLGQYFD